MSWHPCRIVSAESYLGKEIGNVPSTIVIYPFFNMKPVELNYSVPALSTTTVWVSQQPGQSLCQDRSVL